MSEQKRVKIATALTQMTGIDYPIIGAPMFLVSYEPLALAVSRAGGLGMIPLPNYRTPKELETALATLCLGTDKPFGVNIHLSGKFEWETQLAICLDYGVRFFITSLGHPGPLVDRVHARGGKVFADVTGLSQAVSAKGAGADGLVAVAAGAGGHGGTIPLPVLVPYLIDHTGLPVIAAGGISTGAQMASALALGACGVITGTRLIATDEAFASSAYKAAVVQARPEEIVFSNRVTGNWANWIRSSIAHLEEAPDPPASGWKDFWSAGQSVAQADRIRPAGHIVQEMAKDCIATLTRLQKMIDPAKPE